MGGDYKRLPIGVVLKYYKRLDIQKAIVEAAEDKEIAVSYGGTGYGKRPDTLIYPRDVIEAVKAGATSFHCSEELWRNPLQITTGMKSQEYDDLRKGWDLILDIDCKELEYSKIAADLLVQALNHLDVKGVWVKFSGNHGFHIGVPFEAFPSVVNGVPTKNLFPEGPRKIAAYLASMIEGELAKRLMARDSVATISERAGVDIGDIVKGGSLLPFSVLSIDTVLIASRHLYRMPYSLNEKSGLVSIPIMPEDILGFDKSSALPDVVVPSLKFLERDKVVRGEARRLIVQAFDFKAPSRVVDVPVEKKRDFEPVGSAISEEFFPPCIKEISKGLVDGKKRALFILVNFLSSTGWSPDMIEDYLERWNEKNPEPLRDVLIKGRMRYYRESKKRVLPPNCDNKAYMIDLGVCSPDGFCRKVKNPANYAIAKSRMVERQEKSGRQKVKSPGKSKSKSGGARKSGVSETANSFSRKD